MADNIHHFGWLSPIFHWLNHHFWLLDPYFSLLKTLLLCDCPINTRWGLPVTSWFIKPLTIAVYIYISLSLSPSPIHHGSPNYKSTLLSQISIHPIKKTLYFCLLSQHFPCHISSPEALVHLWRSTQPLGTRKPLRVDERGTRKKKWDLSWFKWSTKTWGLTENFWGLRWFEWEKSSDWRISWIS